MAMANSSVPAMAALAPPVVPGQVLGGRHRLLAPVAYGGMGSIWAARRVDAPRGGLVAIKVAHPHFALEQQFREMFLDEARLASSIRHPNVCSVFDMGDENGTLYLAMEWIGGGSLHELLSSGPVPLPVAVRIVADACSGLHAAHELRDDNGLLLDLIHRDVSPQNILLSTTGEVKITDFGVARAKDQTHQTTTTGELKGKLSYMAPEQFGSRAYDRRVDLFSLGCVLYRAIVGKKAFDGTGGAVMQRLIELEFDRPRTVVPDLPQELEDIVMRAMAPVDYRYATADQMRQDLEAWLASTGYTVTRADVASVVQSALGPVVEARRTALEAAGRKVPSPSVVARSEEETQMVPASAMSTNDTNANLGASLSRVTPQRRGTRSVLALVAGGALVTGIGWLASRAAPARHAGSSSAADPRPQTIAVQPASEASLGATASATPPTEIVLSVRANVSGAAVSIDDGTPKPLPLQATYPRDDKQHVLRVVAPGYQASTQVVGFDQSQSLLLSLVAAEDARSANRMPSSARTPRRPTSAQPGAPAVAVPKAASKGKEIDKDDPFRE